MKIKKILVSQPEPADLEKSPYKNLVTKYGVDITFFKFFEVVGLTVSEFRKSRIHLTEYTAVIFNSKNSIDHFFRLAKELREVIPDSMKYFCTSEAIAHYLQNYIQYRKRSSSPAPTRSRPNTPRCSTRPSSNTPRPPCTPPYPAT